MINEKQAKKYCCEDISLIENYKEAVNSNEIYDCHHRLEIDLKKTPKELQELNLYYNRPANELVFITRADHTRLHQTNKIFSQSTKDLLSDAGKKRVGDKNSFYGKRHTEDSKQKMRKPHRKSKWMTPSGEIKEMTKANVTKWHPDWIKIGEV